jgi:glycopeptide antibiotics resistance protein
MRNKIFLVVLTLGVGIVFYLSWLPQPKLSAYWFMPSWLGRWADARANENLRTAVPFLFLGGLCGWWLVNKSKSLRYWVIAFALMLLVATIAEVGQLFLAQRSCDIGDIIWGATGIFAGLASVWLMELIGRFFCKGYEKGYKNKCGQESFYAVWYIIK